MALPIRLLRTAVAVAGPVVLPMLRRAWSDPRTRQQATAILAQARSRAGSVGRSRGLSGAVRDLDATVALTRSRLESARDDEERDLATAWVREAQDARHALDIASGLPPADRSELVQRVQRRREALLRRMLTFTLSEEPGDRAAPQPAPSATAPDGEPA